MFVCEGEGMVGWKGRWEQRPELAQFLDRYSCLTTVKFCSR
jgi:hypothetical protein